MPVWRTAVCFVLSATIASDALQAATPKFEVTVYVNSAPQPVSPEGFVDSSDKWLLDSVADLKKALDGKDFHPNKGFPGSQAHYVVVSKAIPNLDQSPSDENRHSGKASSSESSESLKVATTSRYSRMQNGFQHYPH